MYKFSFVMLSLVFASGFSYEAQAISRLSAREILAGKNAELLKGYEAAVYDSVPALQRSVLDEKGISILLPSNSTGAKLDTVTIDSSQGRPMLITQEFHLPGAVENYTHNNLQDVLQDGKPLIYLNRAEPKARADGVSEVFQRSSEITSVQLDRKKFRLSTTDFLATSNRPELSSTIEVQLPLDRSYDRIHIYLKSPGQKTKSLANTQDVSVFANSHQTILEMSGTQNMSRIKVVTVEAQYKYGVSFPDYVLLETYFDIVPTSKGAFELRRSEILNNGRELKPVEAAQYEVKTTALRNLEQQSIPAPEDLIIYNSVD